MSRNKKIISALIILTAIIISFIGGQTFSKYVTEVSGEGVANVAKWTFKVNDNESQLQSINLASTVNNETLINNKIAPGTSGDFQIKIDATGSDVGINYKVNFVNEKNKPQNLIFTYDDERYENVTDIAEELSGIIDANAEEKTKVINIHWEWPYETGIDDEITNNDIIDTENGKNITQYTFDVLVEGVQVMPETV